MLHKISIIVPVYNVENYVSKCFESIINQTYSNLEIIVINDGSTDNSREICDFYLKKDNRIILINQENQGLSMARNNALDICTGDYIGFVDSDDWIEFDMFYTLYTNAITYEADISVCNAINVTESGEIFPYKIDDGNIVVLENFDKIKDHIYGRYNCVWNKLYKRYLFNNIRFPKGKLFEDIFITHQLIDKANKIVKSPEYKYYYLLRNNSITLSPFTLKKMDLVEAQIDKYKYISKKYPDLERICRKYIFIFLIDCMYEAYINGFIEKNQEELLKIINIVKKYDINDCGLTVEQKNILILLFLDIKSYIAGIRFFVQQSKTREYIENKNNNK